jgi:hypothetical protein
MLIISPASLKEVEVITEAIQTWMDRIDRIKRKDEGGRMKRELLKTTPRLSSFRLHPSSFSSYPVHPVHPC